MKKEINILTDEEARKEIDLKIKRMLGSWFDEPVFSKNKYIESAYLFFWKWYYRLTSSLYFKIKYALQRLCRGYDDLDTWNAAWYIARKAVPVLRAMRNRFHGTSIKWHREDRFGSIEALSMDEVYAGSKEPGYEGPNAFTEDEWRAILDDIIFAFQWQIDLDTYHDTRDEQDFKASEKRQKRGLQLFSIYYRNLWD
jgi:hypothetical protein